MECEYDKRWFEVLNERKTIKRIGDSSHEIFYWNKESKKGKYTWTLRVDHHPGYHMNIYTGDMTKAWKENSKL